MKIISIVTFACLFLVALAMPIQASETNTTAQKQFVDDMYPGLTTGALAYACASTLPEEILLKAGNLVINGKELSEEITKADEKMQPALRKNAFFILEPSSYFCPRRKLRQQKAAMTSRKRPNRQLSRTICAA